MAEIILLVLCTTAWSSLNSYIAHEMPDLNMKLLSDTFKCVKNTLDTIMADQAAQGLGVPKMEDYVTEEMEEKLWKMGMLGESNPDQLRNTILFLVGSRFGVRGGKKHALCLDTLLLRFKLKKFMAKDAWCIVKGSVRPIREEFKVIDL